MISIFPELSLSPAIGNILNAHAWIVQLGKILWNL